jgi:hypothetical protein
VQERRKRCSGGFVLKLMQHHTMSGADILCHTLSGADLMQHFLTLSHSYQSLLALPASGCVAFSRVCDNVQFCQKLCACVCRCMLV